MLLQEDDVTVYSLTLLLNVFSLQMSTEKYFKYFYNFFFGSTLHTYN